MPRPSSADGLAALLLAGAAAALGPWVVASVHRTWRAGGSEPPVELMAEAERARQAAVAEVIPDLAALLALPVGDQAETPLALIRRATAYPTLVLARAGLAPVDRDPDRRRLFPDDLYDLSPATFGDLDPDLGPVALAWGAWKASTLMTVDAAPTEPQTESPTESSPTPPVEVVAYVPDLMDRSRMTAAGPVSFVRRPQELAEVGADVYVVDLNRPGAGAVAVDLATRRAGQARIIGFTNHTDRATLAEAASNGVESMPRSAFFAGLSGLWERS
ncbi:MAG: hypothetical protein ACT4OS_10475 [Acidimicrobiales bacterium]